MNYSMEVLPVELIRSTTKLDTKQMTEYQENIERWASQLGWSWEL